MWPKFFLATSFKVHLFLAVLLACWVVLFLILLSPFDVSDLTTINKWILMPFYGVLLIISYMGSYFFQNWLYKKQGQTWHLGNELLFMTIFLTLCYGSCVTYYHSSFMNGTLSAQAFFLQQYIPLSIIILPMLFFLRWAAGRIHQNSQSISPQDSKIILKGNNQKEVLRLDFRQIAYVKAADNYVEVHYQEGQQVQMKLLRSTLKKINTEAPSLMRAHRSYLINPDHFQQWMGSNSIMIAQTEIPISKTYKAQIEKRLSFTTPKT